MHLGFLELYSVPCGCFTSANFGETANFGSIRVGDSSSSLFYPRETFNPTVAAGEAKLISNSSHLKKRKFLGDAENRGTGKP